LVARHRFAVTLAAGAVGLFVCEGLVRALHAAPLPRPRADGSILRHSADPQLAFENKPGGVLTLTYVDAPGEPERVVVARVNAQGFRGAEVAKERSDGVARIACIGDSHTFGYGVGEGEAWPHVLERALQRDGGRVEVLNCGVDGYDSEQESLWLERAVLPYAPDRVLLGFYLNDTAMRAAEPGGELPVSQRPGWCLRLVDPARDGFVRAVRDHSQFADFLADALYRRQSLALYARARTELFDPEHPSWLRVRAALLRMRDACAEHGARFTVVLYPFLFRQGEHLASHDAFAIVSAYCRDQGIECIDLEPAFDGVEVDCLRLHPHDYHANATAHQIVGEAVANALTHSGTDAASAPERALTR
jgi:lysophospholipase L1-like esterase